MVKMMVLEHKKQGSFSVYGTSQPRGFNLVSSVIA
jgi:hypothetical protein